jgi:hypothetical protein
MPLDLKLEDLIEKCPQCKGRGQLSPHTTGGNYEGALRQLQRDGR